MDKGKGKRRCDVCRRSGRVIGDVLFVAADGTRVCRTCLDEAALRDRYIVRVPEIDEATP